MKKRTLSDYEKEHLKHPYPLEKYFQKRKVFLVTVIFLVPLLIYGFVVSFLDIIKSSGNRELPIWQAAAIVIMVPITFVDIYYEYIKYRDNLWKNKSSPSKKFR